MDFSAAILARIPHSQRWGPACEQLSVHTSQMKDLTVATKPEDPAALQLRPGAAKQIVREV